MSRNIRKYIFEFIIIFVSISLSFALESWRETKNEKRKTKELLIRFSAEMSARSRITENYFNLINAQRQDIKKILDGFLGKPTNADSLLYLIIFTDVTPSYDYRIKSWESIVNSGSINLIDINLIDSVNFVQSYYQDIDMNNSHIKDLVNSKWLSVIDQLPAKSYAVEYQNFYFRDSIRKIEPINLKNFYSSSRVADFYTAKHILLTEIYGHFKTILKKEQSLISMIKDEIKKY